MKIEILGVKIDTINLEGILENVSNWLKGDGQHYITTVNPEFVAAAQKNLEFKNILNNADLAICDGFGLVLVSGYKLIRVTGVELVDKLLNLKNENYKIYLLGGEEGIAEAVKQKYSGASIVGAQSGGKLNLENRLLENNEVIINDINNSGANVLLVAFGQVKQETWITNNLAKLPAVKVAIGVGGTFDYLSGKIKRAPAWMRGSGLEWLYRLLKQPKRFGRIFDATVKFLWLIIKNKF